MRHKSTAALVGLAGVSALVLGLQARPSSRAPAGAKCGEEPDKAMEGAYRGKLDLKVAGTGSYEGTSLAYTTTVHGDLSFTVRYGTGDREVFGSSSTQAVFDVTATVHDMPEGPATVKGANEAHDDMLELRGFPRKDAKIVAEGELNFSGTTLIGAAPQGTVGLPGWSGGKLPATLHLDVKRLTCIEIGGTLDPNVPFIQSLVTENTAAQLTTKITGAWSATLEDRDKALEATVDRAVATADADPAPGIERVASLLQLHRELGVKSTKPEDPYFLCVTDRLPRAAVDVFRRRVDVIASQFKAGADMDHKTFTAAVGAVHKELQQVNKLAFAGGDCAEEVVARGRALVAGKLRERLDAALKARSPVGEVMELRRDLSNSSIDPEQTVRQQGAWESYKNEMNRRAAAQGLPPPFKEE